MHCVHFAPGDVCWGVRSQDLLVTCWFLDDHDHVQTSVNIDIGMCLCSWVMRIVRQGRR